MSNNTVQEMGLLKTLWHKDPAGQWSIQGLKGIMLKPRAGFEPDFFPIESKMEMLTDRPVISSAHGLMATFGPTDYLLKQSIVPVVEWVDGETFIRCIGTAFIVSCTGYVMTACHVLLDSVDRKYAKIEQGTNSIKFEKGVRLGVLMPLNPASGSTASLFFPFHDCRCWGQWKKSPFLGEDARFEFATDIAICKISLPLSESGHQPLTLSLNGFQKGERAVAIGYSEMEHIPIVERDGVPTVPEFKQELYVAVGLVSNLYPDNHQQRVVRTPGPCFEFLAKVKGRMSGGPILGADGTVVRGVVNSSWVAEKLAYGAMIAPAMHLSLGENKTFRTLMDSGNEGIAKVMGRGL